MLLTTSAMQPYKYKAVSNEVQIQPCTVYITILEWQPIVLTKYNTQKLSYRQLPTPVSYDGI